MKCHVRSVWHRRGLLQYTVLDFGKVAKRHLAKVRRGVVWREAVIDRRGDPAYDEVRGQALVSVQFDLVHALTLTNAVSRRFVLNRTSTPACARSRPTP
jgi:hypothetical protein